MSKIIGISAAQGQGKSTMIKLAVEENKSLSHLNIQTARDVLQEWGYTLTEVNKYMPLKVKFQDELFVRHYNALMDAKNKSGTFLVERTFADMFSYALISVGPFNEYSRWLGEYADMCNDAQETLFDHVIFLSGREYTPEEDGVRSTNLLFSQLTDYLIQTYTIKFSQAYTIEFSQDRKKNDKVTFLDVADLRKRVDFLNELCKKISI